MSAFIEAYNAHEDVLLAPDDVWLQVCLQFSKHINDHAETLRDRFVDHEGKKKLTVTTWNEGETEWSEFLSLMKIEISKNTKGGIVDVLQSDFSTTGLVERMISTACIMDSFKKFFSYGRCIAYVSFLQPRICVHALCQHECMQDVWNPQRLFHGHEARLGEPAGKGREARSL